MLSLKWRSRWKYVFRYTRVIYIYKVFLLIIFKCFQFLQYLTNCFQYCHIINNIKHGTIPHYVKHMSNVKVVHIKETIKTYNNSNEAFNQKHSNGKMLQKYAAHQLKSTHAYVPIQKKPGGNNTEITGLHRRFPQNPLQIFRAPLIGTRRGKCL